VFRVLLASSRRANLPTLPLNYLFSQAKTCRLPQCLSLMHFDKKFFWNKHIGIEHKGGNWILKEEEVLRRYNFNHKSIKRP